MTGTLFLRLLYPDLIKALIARNLLDVADPDETSPCGVPGAVPSPSP